MGVPLVSQVSTLAVDSADRIAFWEEYNRRELVGLTCSSYSRDGLLAAQNNYRLGGLRLAEISGNEHVIQRTRRTCEDLPKDSVFVSLLTDGEAVFFHEGGCLTVRAGDVVLYDTRRSYLFGFPTRMRQLLMDIPREIFAERCAYGELSAPVLCERGVAATALESVLSDWAAGDGGEAPAHTEAMVLDLVRALVAPQRGGGSAWLAMARSFVDRHLTDPGLSAERVAAAIRVSPRHLSRVFAPSGVSPARYILEQRLARAHEQLGDPGSRHMTVAEIAHRWGFAGQAHFTRVYRGRYGRTPGAARPR
ncbi:helix-turn-helix domain-containing protein [Streptomyces justiciae]|uniref:helix-turn-helix domain-containing protein n=1 Tax=Streptomyces justiciae TaxID=2780140 RepID=UPI0018820E33|nr:helix-turn-helix domain-containing protein [Streptomyces justiciae]MBE8471851.1 helix-turn-helix domain-containing protein [Streptomyces justiciae]